MRQGGMVVLTLCLRYLHRHPAELTHLPLGALADLLAYAELEAEMIEESS